MLGAGELTWLFRDAIDGAKCACGTAVGECEVWGAVLAQLARAMPGFDLHRAAKVTFDTERLFGSVADAQYYLEVWGRTFDAISECSQRRFIVDSSKVSRYAYRRLPLFLRDLRQTTSVLHLVRDPRGVMWSCRRGSNRRLAKGVSPNQFGGMGRGLFSWMFSNAVVERVLGGNGGIKSLRLRYEDLVTNPRDRLSGLGDWLGLRLDEVCERLENEGTFEGGHGIAGNRMRKGGSIVMREDQEWRTRLPRYARMLSVVAGPQMRRYGYFSRGG